MSERLYKRIRFISPVILVLGISAYLLSYSHNKPEAAPAVGFKMISLQTLAFTVDNESRFRATITRYQTADGSWKQETTYYKEDGTPAGEDVGFGKVGQGAFRVNEKKGVLEFLSHFSGNQSTASSDSLRNQPSFLREDYVLGYKTYVFRDPGSEEWDYTETYVCPELGGISLKKVFASKEAVETIEAVTIVKGDIDESVFKNLPELPVDYGFFQKKIEAVEQMGHKKVADQMRKQMEQAQRSQ